MSASRVRNRIAAEIEIAIPHAMPSPILFFPYWCLIYLESSPDLVEIDYPVVLVINKDVPSEALDSLGLMDIVEKVPTIIRAPVNEKVILVVGDGIFVSVPADLFDQVPPSLKRLVGFKESLVIGAVEPVGH